MFTGIIEEVGKVTKIKETNSGIDISIFSNFTKELTIGQSVAHNGVCLTITDILDSNTYTVTAVEETLKKTSLSSLRENSMVNLERALKLQDRLDGHLVQGHVDQTGTCEKIEFINNNWIFTFSHEKHPEFFTIEKGSICINGTSLTCFEVSESEFKVAIIPHTHENTTFHLLKAGDTVNLEFDMIGKYITQLHKNYKS